MTEWDDTAIDRLLGEVSSDGDSLPPLPARYRVIRELGRGGMGAVFEAEDRELGRRVAIKFLSNAFPGDAERERFLREARAAARLTHPSIAAVHDASERYIVMRLVEGEPLSLRPKSPARDAVRWIRDAALGVAAAHEKGIIHRDLKPANLLLEHDHCVVTDFGLAKDATAGELSVTGQVLGTPSYMAPEQAEGRAARIDGTTDVYGLGATLYFLLLGRAPFVAKDREDVLSVLRRVVDEEPPRPRELDPSLPRDLEAIVLRALEKEGSRRYASALDLAEDLTNFLENRPVVARPSTIWSRAARFAARHRRAVASVSLAAIAIAVATAYAWNERSRREGSSAALDLSDRVRAVLDDAKSGLEIGKIEEREERLRSGLEECDRFLVAHDVGWAHVLRGRLLAELGDTTEAIRAFDRALDADPELGAARLARGAVRVDEMFRRVAGRRPDREGTLSPDERELRRAAIADLEAISTWTGTSWVDSTLVAADLAVLHGAFDEARAKYLEVRGTEPTNERARRGLLVIELCVGDGDEALALAMSGMDIGRGFGLAYEARVRSRAFDAEADGESPRLSETHDFVLEGTPWRLTGFETALVARPSDALAHAQRGVVALRRAASLRADPTEYESTLRQALDFLDGAIVLDPGNAAVWNARAVARLELAAVLDSRGEVDASHSLMTQARADLDSALAIQPRDAAALANRARLSP